MKTLLVLTTMIMSFFLVASAQADVAHRHYYEKTKVHSHHYKHTRYYSIRRTQHYYAGSQRYRHRGPMDHRGHRYVNHRIHRYVLGHNRNVGGRPRAWCGWFMRTIFGGGPEYNVAANWRHRGSPTSPHAGAIVVWPHHVGLITGRNGGRWIVKSGNWGGRVATVPMSLRGAIAFRNP